MKTQHKKTLGVIEYCLFRRFDISAILASLLISSFVVATAAPWMKNTPEPRENTAISTKSVKNR